MGGGIAITPAGTYPDRFAAVASFHGGNLATDAPASPHRYAPQLKAELYIAAAEGDESYPLPMAQRLENAFDQAGVRYCAETYVGAAHGWMKPDFPVYDPVAAERGWSKMIEFFNRILKKSSNRKSGGDSLPFEDNVLRFTAERRRCRREAFRHRLALKKALGVIADKVPSE